MDVYIYIIIYYIDAEDLKYDQSIIGSINENSGAIAYKFGLTNLDQTNSHPEVVLRFGKSKESSNLIIGINPKTFVSNPKDAIWQAFTLDNLNATITINDQADEYCVGCTYYISIGYYSSQSTDDSVYEISLLCPNNDCNSCNDPHFTPESDCKECVSDYYGEDCSNLCNCNHGVCNDGRTGEYIYISIIIIICIVVNVLVKEDGMNQIVINVSHNILVYNVKHVV